MRYLLLFVAIISITSSSACSDEPISGNPPASKPDMDMDGGGDGIAEIDMNPDMDLTPPNQRLVLQPVSGSGSVKSAKFRAHIQVGRIVDATSK